MDVVVIGGGAAGIAAARRLQELGRSALLIEAGARLGGRARTERIEGMALDFGCEWLHSGRRNPFAALALAKGAPVDRSEAAWSRELDDPRARPAERRSARAAYEAFLERLRVAPPASDRAGDAMGREEPWRGYVDGLSGFVNGVGLDALSVADFLAYEDHAGEENWRLPEGFGALVEGLGAGLRAALATKAHAVRVDREVVVETSGGTIHALAAIVAVPTAALASGSLRFEPHFEDHLAAAADLPLGLANKAFFALPRPEDVPPETHLLGRYDSARTASHYFRPLGMPVLECFLGGDYARDLERSGKGAMEAACREEVARLMGADFSRGMRMLGASRWGAEPLIGGSYSHAMPGRSQARRRLASPPHPLLAFAGEACSPYDFSTAHGAWASGVSAAEAIASALPGKSA